MFYSNLLFFVCKILIFCFIGGMYIMGVKDIVGNKIIVFFVFILVVELGE